MTDVWTGVPEDVEPTPEDHTDHGRWAVPGEPDEGVIGVEAVHAQQEEAAREAARAFYLMTATGVWLPRPEIESWPERDRKAFEDELSRLEAERRGEIARLVANASGRAKGGPS
jgi:hypothetical protein